MTIGVMYSVVIGAGALGISTAILERLAARRDRDDIASLIVLGMKVFMFVTVVLGLLALSVYSPLL